MEEQDDAPRTATGDPVVEVLARADALLSELASVNLWAGSDADARARVEAVAALEARLGSFYLSAVHDLDTRESAVAGARPGKTALAFLIQKLRRDPGRARADVEAARALADTELLADSEADDLDGLPLVGAAFAAGEISREHVDRAVAAFEKIPAHLRDKVDGEGRSGRARADELLAEHARLFNPSTSGFLAGQLLDMLDPEGRDRFDPDAVDRRHLGIGHSRDGMTLIRGQADAVSALWIEKALEHFSRQGADRVLERQDEDSEEGQQVLKVADRRSKGQRQLDALATMARLAMGAPDAGVCAGERPHISVEATLDTLRDAMNDADADADAVQGCADAVQGCADADEDFEGPGGPERPERSERSEQARRASGFGLRDVRNRTHGRIDLRTRGGAALLGALICDSAVQTIVTGKQGQILDIGRLSRAVPLRLRKLVTVRDRGCIICGADPSRCEAHHVRWWRNGGETWLQNLALLCGGCHTLVHLGVWDVRMTDGVPEVRPPDWLDAERRWWTPRPARERQASDQARQLALDLVNGDPNSASEGRAA